MLLVMIGLMIVAEADDDKEGEMIEVELMEGGGRGTAVPEGTDRMVSSVGELLMMLLLCILSCGG